MARVEIKKATKEALLDEFNHRCAICGSDRPQIHHIDENAENNSMDNLIPLCPNCHLTDHHNPTKPVDNRKLALFRTHKDPAILTSQYEPLFRRILFLIELNRDTFDTETIQDKSRELIGFVDVLEMGAFYSAQIEQLLHPPPYARVHVEPTDEEMKRWEEEYRIEYYETVDNSRESVISLTIELLRYQDWIHQDRI